VFVFELAHQRWKGNLTSFDDCASLLHGTDDVLSLDLLELVQNDVLRNRAWNHVDIDEIIIAHFGVVIICFISIIV